MSGSENNPSFNIFEQISQICRDFRKQISQGRSPRIEKYLASIVEDGRENLFSNLLEIEINFRRSNGQRPNSEEYLKRFSQYAKQVRRAFFEPTIGMLDSAESCEESTRSLKSEIAVPEHTASFQIPDANRLGDYELMRELGRGGMGVVYEARHTKTNNRVALKTLPTGTNGQEINADRLHKFRREFRALSEINHPNLVGMQTLEVDGSQWFFTMDLIAGEDFLSWTRPNDKTDEERLRSAIKALAAGIIFLHKQGIVHRDLKPSNVLVEDSGRLVILDFGLVAQLQTQKGLTVSRSGMFAGTPRYAAPEQMFGERSEASDWYALGTMLFEALTGSPPFTGEPMELLRKKQSQAPPRLLEQEKTKHANDLASLADGLLVRDPQHRLNTTQIIEALQLNLETQTYGTTSGSRGSSGSVDDDQLDWEPHEEVSLLVGREAQLAELESAKTAVLENRKPVVVWISGKSGNGKSSLIDKFLRPIRQGTEMVVLSGRCYDRESVPFKVIDCWMDSLTSFLRGRDERYLRDVVTRELFWLTQIFPILKRVKAIDSLPSIDSALIKPENLRPLAFSALRNLLARIARKTPIVISVDDLQWGDAGSLSGMHQILKGPNASAILFVGGYRSDEADGSPFLNGWNSDWVSDIRDVRVAPLNFDQTLQLGRQLIKDAPNQLTATFRQAYEESGGNPFLLTQLLSSFDRASGNFQPIPFRELVSRRLAKLPQEARPILEMLSVFGKAIRNDQIEELVGLDHSPVATLMKMRNEQLIRWLGSDLQQMVDTCHDQIREEIVSGLSDSDRRDWHLRIAENLQKSSATNPIRCEEFPLYDDDGLQTPSPEIQHLFDLARHLNEGGDQRAIEYLILAGEQNLRTYSNEEAVEHFELAQNYLGNNASNAIRFRVLSGLAQANLRILGLANDAIKFSQRALTYASCNSERVLALSTEATALGHLGQLSRAIGKFDDALIELGCRRPQAGVSQLIRFTIGLIKCSVAPEFSFPMRSTNRSLSFREFEIYNAMKTVVAAQTIFAATLDVIVRGNFVALRTKDSELEALGYSGTFLALGFLQLPRAATLALKRFSRRDFDYSNPLLESSSNVSIFHGNYFLAKFDEAVPMYESSISTAEQCGDINAGIFARHMMRHIDGWRSSANKELEVAKDELRFGKETKSSHGIFWGYFATADPLARAGRLDEAFEHLREAWRVDHVDDNSGIASCHCTQAFLMLQSSNYERAIDSCRQCWDHCLNRWYFADYIVRCLPLLTQALLGPNWLNNHDKENHKHLKSASRWMTILSPRIKTTQPLTFHAWGRMAASKGKIKKSIRLFERSATIAKSRKMPYYHARALLDLAAVREEGREANRTEAIRLLKEMNSVIPRAESWLLGDQYDEMVVAPKFDLAAWEKEHGPVTPHLDDLEETD